MVLARRNQLGQFERMNDLMERMWHGYSIPRPNNVHFMEDWSIPMDLVEEDDKLVVRASLPGMNPEDIDVTIEHDVLTINAETKTEEQHSNGNYIMAECRSGKFHRSLRMPDSVDSERAETTYHNGVLTVTFPKLEAKKAKTLKVKVSS